jgi:predicted transcriptional regulator of viral defense system
MNSLSAYSSLRELHRPVIRTGDAAERLKTTSRNANRILGDAAQAGLLAHLRHGMWLLDLNVDRQAMVPYLTAPYPSYVSLWTALAHHDMIEQIPRMVYAVTLGRSQTIRTSRGDFALHHIIPELFGGFIGRSPGRFIATPEKSLFDSVYLQAVQGATFRPPELTLPHVFDAQRMNEWVARISAGRLRTLVRRTLDTILAATAR